MHSPWQKSLHHKSDIAIIGAGLTGLLSAISLKQSNPKLGIRLFEKGAYPEGASAKNAGFACFGSVSELLDDLEHEGEDHAFERVLKRYQGLQQLLSTIVGQDIQYKPKGGVEIFTQAEQELFEKSLDHLGHFNQKLQSSLGFEPFSPGDSSYGMTGLAGTIQIKSEATLHSGKLLQALLYKARSLGVELRLSCEIKELQQANNVWLLSSSQGEFEAERVLLATNGFTKALLPNLPIIPARGQVLLTSKIPGLQIDRSFHLHQGYFYFREYEGAVLFGGGRHLDRENESNTSQQTTDYIQSELERLLREVILPNQEFEIQSRWAGTMAFGPQNEKEPIVKPLGNGLYVAARLGGMGVAISALVAQQAAKMMVDA